MKTKKKLSAILLAGTMLFSMGTTAFAEESGPVKPDALQITKNFELAEGLSIPENAVFRFSADAFGDNSSNAPKVTIDPVSYDKGKPQENAQNGKYTLIKNAKVTISELKKPGIYTYKLKEINDGLSGVTYSDEEYTLRVKIINGDQNTLQTASVVIEDKGGKKVTEIPFTNIYQKDSSLTIEKTITGENANKSKKFTFAITLKKSATSNATEFTGKIGEESLTFMDGQEKTFELSDGQKLIFEHLPVGTTYTVREIGIDGDEYTPSITVIENGQQIVNNKQGTEKDDLSSSVSGKDNILVGEGDNKVTFINTYNSIPLTGIFLDSIPFILLIALAVVAFGILAAAKKSHNLKKS